MNSVDVASGVVTAFLMLICGTLVTVCTINHRSTIRLQLWLFLVAFVVRFTLSVLLYGYGLAETIVGSGDDSGWVGGVIIKRSWEAQGISPLNWPVALLEAYNGHHAGYGYLLAVVFSLIPLTSQLSAAAVDCLFGALEAVLSYRIARLYFSEWVAVRAGWWTCLFPLMIIWSAQSIKEPVVILLETTGLYGCLCIKTRGLSIRHILLSAISLLVLPTFRFYAAYVVGCVVLLTLALPQVSRKRMPIVASLAIGTIVIPMLSSTGIMSRHVSSFEEWSDVNRTVRFRRDIAAGTGSGVESNYDMKSSGGFSLATIDGALHLLLAPFPWEMRLGSLRMILTMPEMLVWWHLFFRGFIPGIRNAIWYRLSDMLPLLLFLLGLGLIYSITFGNVGVVYRQRAQLMPFLLMFTASGLELRELRKRPKWAPAADSVPSTLLPSIPMIEG